MKSLRRMFVFLLIVTIPRVFGRKVVFNGTSGMLFVFDHFLDTCKESKPTNWLMNFKNFKTAQIGATNFLDFDVDISSTIYSAYMEVDFQKCASIETPDTCKRVFTFKTQRFCQFVEDDKAFWSPLTMCITPKAKCPLRKGIYRGRNCSFDMSLFNWFPVDRKYWKSTTQLTIGKRKLPGACMLFSGYTISKK